MIKNANHDNILISKKDGQDVENIELDEEELAYKEMMEKRFDQQAMTQLVSKIESMTGKTISAREKLQLTKGADEVDLVRSGLEETMITAHEEIFTVYNRRKNVKDLRTAAFLVALEKVANDYEMMGIFP